MLYISFSLQSLVLATKCYAITRKFISQYVSLVGRVFHMTDLRLHGSGLVLSCADLQCQDVENTW